MISEFNKKEERSASDKIPVKVELEHKTIGKQADQLLSVGRDLSTKPYRKPEKRSQPEHSSNKQKNRPIIKNLQSAENGKVIQQNRGKINNSRPKNEETEKKKNRINHIKKQNNRAPQDSNGQEHSNNQANQNKKKRPSIKVAFLGGLNEIGKNITLFECEGDMFLLDCGMAFPDENMPGVDIVIPDFSYVEQVKDKIKGIVITHGHEDHIGSLPYLIGRVNLPIYGTKLSIGLIQAKLKEAGLHRNAKLNTVKPKQRIKFGCMQVEMIHVNHSIPGAVAVAIHSPAGTLIHTGDFKIDCTPPQDAMIDLGRFAQLGKEGVLALFADSTNAERPGYTMTEQRVIDSFDKLFREAENKRIIVASFASNIGRIEKIVHCAAKYGRKVAYSGRSMISYMSISGELGYLNMPKDVIIDIDLLNRYPKEKVVLITTGSQGEPMSALTRMAYSDHRKVEVGPDDFIIISANPIPGNEKTVGAVVNELMKRGCQVVYESMHDVHVSGHACQEELKIIQGLVKPKYFIPVHGEQKHLRKHANLAHDMGMPESNIFIGDVGDKIEISEDSIKRITTVPSGRVFVDGSGVGDVGNEVLKERKLLSEDGLIIVSVTVDAFGNVVSGPEIFSKGFVYMKESKLLIELAKKRAVKILESCTASGFRDWGSVKIRLRDELSKLFFSKTKRTPVVLPIIMNIH